MVSKALLTNPAKGIYLDPTGELTASHAPNQAALATHSQVDLSKYIQRNCKL